MDALHEHLIKVNILMLILSCAAFSFANEIIFSKRGIKGKNFISGIANIFVIILCVAGGVFISYDLTMDNVNFAPKTITGKVIQTDATPGSWFVVEKVILDNKVAYRVFFKNANLQVGKAYDVTYAERSKTILQAKEKE